METENKVIAKNIGRNHKICMENRKNLSLTGIERVDNASPNRFSCVASGLPLNIDGKDIQVIKLDVEEGIVELAGEFDRIEYTGPKQSIFKKIFK